MRRAFREEVREATRTTGITAGLIALVAFPAWFGFDYVVAPSHVHTFLVIHLVAVIPMLILWLGLLGPLGHRRPELLLLGLAVVIEGAIALMIVRVHGSQYAAYAVGMSLVIYAGAFLLIWSWRYTATLIGLIWAMLGAAVLTAPAHVPAAGLVTIGYYLATASVFSFFGQLHRERLAWREFRGRAELEIQQTRNQELVEELARLSHEDSLTGLANRRSWDRSLEEEIARAAAEAGEIAMLLCDVDNFKDVNDEMGHAVGDSVLRTSAQLLTTLAGRDDRIVARLGGDEFAVLCPGCAQDDAVELAERLRQGFEELPALDAGTPTVTCSIGVAGARGDETSATELMLFADERLYQAKRTRNSVCSAAHSPGPRIGRAAS